MPARRHDGPWDSFQKPKTLPLWTKAVLAFSGAVVATQIGIWQYQDYMADRAFAGASASALASAPSDISQVPLATARAVQASDSESAAFGFCHEGGGSNCVVDGDTIYYQGIKIRIADIDTPETHEPRCEQEAALGAAATRRLHMLINAGPFSLASANRDADVYGRKLRILTRGGESLGETLVSEGLARWYEGGRRPWC